jgi:hypothetical protein
MCRCTTSGEGRAAEEKVVEMERVAMVVAMVAVEKAVGLAAAATVTAGLMELEATVGTWAAGRSQYNLFHSRTEPRLHTVR